MISWCFGLSLVLFVQYAAVSQASSNLEDDTPYPWLGCNMEIDCELLDVLTWLCIGGSMKCRDNVCVCVRSHPTTTTIKPIKPKTTTTTTTKKPIKPKTTTTTTTKKPIKPKTTTTTTTKKPIKPKTTTTTKVPTTTDKYVTDDGPVTVGCMTEEDCGIWARCIGGRMECIDNMCICVLTHPTTTTKVPTTTDEYVTDGPEIVGCMTDEDCLMPDIWMWARCFGGRMECIDNMCVCVHPDTTTTTEKYVTDDPEIVGCMTEEDCRIWARCIGGRMECIDNMCICVSTHPTTTTKKPKTTTTAKIPTIQPLPISTDVPTVGPIISN